MAKKSRPQGTIERLRELYEGPSDEAVRFRYGLLVFDFVTIAFIVLSSFMPRSAVLEWIDALFGLLILADLVARFLISRNRLRELLHPVTWADMIAVVSFLAPLAGEGAGFLRILRTLRRFISVVIMIFGVTLFYRLARAILQPYKVRFPCPKCGLQRHETDAVHCKACGTTLNIPNDDED